MRPAWFEEMVNWDKDLFRMINSEWTNEYLDVFFVFITGLHRNDFFIYFMVPAILVAGLWFHKFRFIKILAAMAIAIGLTDTFNYRVLKHLSNRPRPLYTEGVAVQLKVPTSPVFSGFPSNHAANCFAGATILSAAFPQAGALYFTIAALVAYSRPYVGVHFPLDVIFGALVGWCIARLLLKFFFRPIRWWQFESNWRGRIERP